MSSPQVKGIGVHVKVADISKSREFYESLGFKPVFGYGDDEFRASLPEGCGSAPERYRGITYQLTEDINYEIAEGHIAVKPEVFSEIITSPKISAMIRVNSLESILKNHNVNRKFPVRRYYWGTIEAAVRDPDGFVLVFVAQDTDEERAAVAELVDLETVDAG
jgi:catechol 2,3-dioxygenase-like lactoylglutathione lyase family enzyme